MTETVNNLADVETLESKLDSAGLSVRLSDVFSLSDLIRVKLGMDLRKEVIDDYIKHLFKDIPEVQVFSSKLFHHCRSRTKVKYTQRSMPNLKKDVLGKEVLIFCLPDWKIAIIFHPELVKENKHPPLQIISQEKGEFRQEILFMKKVLSKEFFKNVVSFDLKYIHVRLIQLSGEPKSLVLLSAVRFLSKGLHITEENMILAICEACAPEFMQETKSNLETYLRNESSLSECDIDSMVEKALEVNTPRTSETPSEQYPSPLSSIIDNIHSSIENFKEEISNLHHQTPECPNINPPIQSKAPNKRLKKKRRNSNYTVRKPQTPQHKLNHSRSYEKISILKSSSTHSKQLPEHMCDSKLELHQFQSLMLDRYYTPKFYKDEGIKIEKDIEGGKDIALSDIYKESGQDENVLSCFLLDGDITDKLDSEVEETERSISYREISMNNYEIINGPIVDICIILDGDISDKLDSEVEETERSISYREISMNNYEVIKRPIADICIILDENISDKLDSEVEEIERSMSCKEISMNYYEVITRPIVDISIILDGNISDKLDSEVEEIERSISCKEISMNNYEAINRPILDISIILDEDLTDKLDSEVKETERSISCKEISMNNYEVIHRPIVDICISELMQRQSIRSSIHFDTLFPPCEQSEASKLSVSCEVMKFDYEETSFSQGYHIDDIEFGKEPSSLPDGIKLMDLFLRRRSSDVSSSSDFFIEELIVIESLPLEDLDKSPDNEKLTLYTVIEEPSGNLSQIGGSTDDIFKATPQLLDKQYEFADRISSLSEEDSYPGTLEDNSLTDRSSVEEFPNVNQVHSVVVFSTRISINTEAPILQSTELKQSHSLETVLNTEAPILHSTDLKQSHSLETVLNTEAPILQSTDLKQSQDILNLSFSELVFNTEAPILQSTDLKQSQDLLNSEILLTNPPDQKQAQDLSSPCSEIDINIEAPNSETTSNVKVLTPMKISYEEGKVCGCSQCVIM